MGRIRKAVEKANKKVTIQIAAALISGSTLISFLFGFFRLRLLNAAYYDTYKPGLDAYIAAFKLPDFMFFILVSGALSVTFIPVFNQRLISGNKKSAWELSSSMINFMALSTLVASVLMIIFAEPLMRYIIAPNLDETSMALAISMMRVIAVNPFLFAISAVIASMQQAVGRFAFFTMAPILYNIGIVIGITVFTNGINIFGWQVFDGGIMGVALGVVFGSILQLIVSCVGLIGLGFDYQYKIYWKNKGFRQVLRLLPARSIDQGMDYIVGIIETNIASRFKAGSIAAFDQASTLHMAPINLIGVAISTAAFPRMTERLADGRMDLFKSELQSVIRVIVWLALPVSIITFFTRGYVVSFIKNGGDALIASILGAFVIAIFFRSIYFISARSFYAQQDTKTPLYISIFAIVLNIVLALYLTSPAVNMNVYGLAWAQSIVSIIEVIILFVAMSRRIPGLFDKVFWHGVARMASATGFMAVVCYVMVIVLPFRATDNSFIATFPKFCVIVGTSMLAYILFSHMLKLKEARPILRVLRKTFLGYLELPKR
jgi:putative peptidoglycan lipid II flippase